MTLCPLLVFFFLSGFLAVKPVLAALPDLVVRIAPSKVSKSNSVTTRSDNEEAPIEILAKRAQFGSRDHSLVGIIVRPPDYDSLLCERYKRTVDIDQFGNIDLVALPPYPKPDDRNSTVMLVPRGECSFERKAYAAKHFYGAKGIMIYDQLSARYGWNTSTDEVIFPQDKVDYDCGNGNTMMKNLPLDPPAYNATQLDLLMGSARIIPSKDSIVAQTNRDDSSSNVDVTSVCNLTNTALKPCESQLCLVTSHIENSTDFPACCAWDTPVTMPIATDAEDLYTDDILALWITIRQAELIFQSDLLSFGSEVSIETRGSKSAFNSTYVIMWIWGTMVMMVGAWYAARDYRIFGTKLAAYKASKEKTQTSHRDSDPRRPRRKISDQPNEPSSSEKKERMRLPPKRNIRDKTEEPESNTDLESGEHSFQDEDDKLASKNRKQKIRTGAKKKTQTNRKKPRSKQQETGVWSLNSLPPPERKTKKKAPVRASSDQNGGGRIEQTNIGDEVENETSSIPARESATITPFEMTQWHVLCFVVMASLTLVLLFFFKIYTLIFILYGIGCAGAICFLVFNPLVAKVVPKLGNSWVEEFNKPVICGCNGFSVTSQLFSYIWTGVWIWYGITHHRPQTNAFFWISLNVLGASFCILSVSVLKLTSIKIATLLMVAIFLYDIFFVFITPFLTPGGASVMLEVATGSQDPGGEDFCYKYPDDRWCKGIGFLPMLFIFPKVNDYANGSVLLGLGDIILPGFLIAFSARHDEAARLVSEHMTDLTNSDINRTTKWYEGYFFPMLMAYSLGLFFAFVAVILMEQGQPALLYICPICLTTILILGRRDIKNLWNGVKVLKQADFLISKTEREWGKSRMKRFAERRRRENVALTKRSDNKQDMIEIPPEMPRINQSESAPPGQMQPRLKDICIGHENHPGTRFLRNIVEEVRADFGEEEYKPEIFKVVKRKLRGRRFFIKKDSVWGEASKLETRKEIGRAYDRARGRRSAVLDDELPEA